MFTGVEPGSGAPFLRLFRVAARGGRARAVFARPVARDGAPLNMARPAFAPNGTALAYSAYELVQGAPAYGPPAIGLATLPGLTASLLTPPDPVGRDDYPTWTGNDTVIFSRAVLTPTPGVRLFRIGRNGGIALPVTMSEGQSADLMAAVSRRGTLAFVRRGFGAGSVWYSFGQNRASARVVIARPNGSLARQLPGSRCEWPSWSPGGSTLVYDCGAPYGRHALYRVRADGTGLRRLTNGHFDDTTPAWSPDGRWIAFARGTIGHPHAIYVMPAGGGAAIRVTGRNRVFGDAQQPAWQPAITARRVH